VKLSLAAAKMGFECSVCSSIISLIFIAQ